MNINAWWLATLPVITAVALKIIGAGVLYIVGRWLIGFAARLVNRVLTARSFDSTLRLYVDNILSITLNVILVIAILGYFGVETTSFAALLAAIGIAIGAAWSGLLANFAAGAFLIIFRPFKVGDFVTVGGVTGTVTQLGLFASTITAPDNVQAIVGNGKISADTILNFSAHAWRRVDRTAQLASTVDPLDAITRLTSALPAIPNVIANPAPDIEILEFNALGTVLAVRPYCHNDHYWQVYFDTNKLIAATFGAAGYPGPATSHIVHRLPPKQ